MQNTILPKLLFSVVEGHKKTKNAIKEKKKSLAADQLRRTVQIKVASKEIPPANLVQLNVVMSEAILRV